MDSFEQTTLLTADILDNATWSDNATLNDSHTARCVNRAPRFLSTRTLPFISVLWVRGFLCFPSLQSWEIFFDNNRKFTTRSLINGMGVPLLHAVPTNVIRSLWSLKRNVSEKVMTFFRYKIVDTKDDLLQYPQYEILLRNETHILIKFEFGHVFKKTASANKTIHDLNFYNGENYQMCNINNKLHIDTTIDSLNLKWFGFSGFATPFGSNDIKCFILDDDYPTYMNDDSAPSANNNRRGATRSLGSMPLWATYNDDNISRIPKKRTNRLANFTVNEINIPDSNDQGIVNVPWNTQVLTCMCMLFHEYESRKERRHNNRV